MIGLGLSFKKSGLDLDRKVLQSARLCCSYQNHFHIWS